ncbi:hypothetical protein ABE527_10795 [Brucella sp. TWI432]
MTYHLMNNVNIIIGMGSRSNAAQTPRVAGIAAIVKGQRDCISPVIWHFLLWAYRMPVVERLRAYIPNSFGVCQLLGMTGTPKGNRTPVCAVRGRKLKNPHFAIDRHYPV